MDPGRRDPVAAARAKRRMLGVVAAACIAAIFVTLAMRAKSVDDRVTNARRREEAARIIEQTTRRDDELRRMTDAIQPRDAGTDAP